MPDEVRQELAGLSPAQQRRLALRLRQRRSSQAPAAAAAPPGADTDPAPLSFAQERLWFLDRINPGDPAYNVPIVLRVTGPLDSVALGRALAAVLRRQPALRTSFVEVNGEPRQVVRDQTAAPLRAVDLRGLPPEERRAAAASQAIAHAHHAFDLAVGPPIAALLLVLAEAEHLLLITVHHIAFDGWSGGVLLSDLVASYGGFAGGVPAALPPLTVQFVDHASAERAAGEAGLAGHLAYWQDRLAGAPALSTLPPDRPRPPAQTHRARHRAFDVSAETTEGLVGLARAHGVTLNAVVLAGFAALLSRTAGQSDVLLGVPVAGRTAAGTEHLVGCFANTIVLRVDMADDPTGDGLVRQVHRALAAGQAHQAAPFARVVEDVAPARDPRYNALFQIMISVTEGTQPQRSAAGVDFVVDQVEGVSTDFDAFVTIAHADGVLRGVFRYNADLYLDETIDQVLDRFAAVLADLAVQPGHRLSELASLRRREILVAASFTADPIRTTIAFWSGFLRVPVAVRLAPYGQVVQHLLNPADTDTDSMVVLVRWADWLRHTGTAVDGDVDTDRRGRLLDQVVDDLVDAVRRAGHGPLLMLVCPSPPGHEALCRRADERLARGLAAAPDVALVWVSPQRYAVTETHDPTADEIGNVPYTPDFFAAIGTAVMDHLTVGWGVDPGPQRAAYMRTQLATAEAVADRARVSGPPVYDPQRSVEPRTQTERRLVDLWRGLLPTHPFDVVTSFFAAGGHSLLATQLLSRVRSGFGCAVPLHEFFREPTIEWLGSAIDTAREPTGPDAPLVRVARDRELPASFTQLRLWALSQLDGDAARHNTTFAARISGPLDRTALRHAVAGIVHRHEILRTGFVNRGGRPVLAIAADADPWLPDLDLRELPEVRRETAVRERIAEHGQAVYDLAHGPLLRLRLLRTGPAAHHLLISMHHAICDNASWGRFFAELAELYGAAVSGRAAELAPLPVQYADHAHWQREWLTGDDAAGQVRYWHERLAGAPAQLELPTDHPRPARPTYRSARVARTLPADLGVRLRELSRGEGVPLFPALLAGLGIVLHRASGQDDIVLGVVTAGRERAEVTDLIGYFADLLPFRLDLAGLPTYRRLLRRVQATAVAAYQRQAVPLARIVEAVRPPRRPGVHPLFQCAVSFIDEKPVALELPGLDVERVASPATGTDFDLFVTLQWRDERLVVVAEYPTALFTETTVTGWLADFEEVLAAAVDAPDEPIGEPGADPTAGVAPVAASFDAAGLEGPVGYWSAQSGVPIRIAPQPAGRVFTALLDTADGADGAARVFLLRWTDWLEPAGEPSQVRLADGVRMLDELVDDLVAAVRRRGPRPLLVVTCPAAPAWAGWAGAFGRLDERLAAELSTVTGVEVDAAARWAHRYGVATAYRPTGDSYTEELLAALGAQIVRRLLAAGRQPGWLLLPESGWRRCDVARIRLEQHRYGRQVLAWPPESGPVDTLARLVDAGTCTPADCVVLDTNPVTVASVLDRFPDTVALTAPAGGAELWQFLGHVWPLDPPGPGAVEVSAMPAAQVARIAEYSTGILASAEDPAENPAPVEPSSPARPLDPGRIHGRDTVGQAGPWSDPRAGTLAEIWADLLHVEQVGIHDDFFELGGDSMLAVQAVYRAATAGIFLAPQDLVDHRTIAAFCAARPAVDPTGGPDQPGQADPAAAPAQAGEPTPADESAPLTGAQRWYLDLVGPKMPRPAHFNHPYYLDLREPMPPEQVERAIRLLAARHGALRIRLPGGDAAGGQTIGPPAEVPFTSHDVSALADTEYEQRIVELAAQAQRGLDLGGPLFRAEHFRLGRHGPDRLLLICHHLVTDGVSRGILLADLQALCRGLLRGKPAAPPAGTTPYLAWARRLAGYADSDEITAELPFWLAQAGGATAAMPPDIAGGRTRFATLTSVRAMLSEPETTALRESTRRLRTHLPAALTWAVAAAMAERTGHTDRTFALTGHGREALFDGVDTSRTVGWFQVFYPLRLRLPEAYDEPAAVADLAAQLAGTPHGGVGYGLLRFLRDDPAVRDQLAQVPWPQVSINYTGHFRFDDAEEGGELFRVRPPAFGRAQDGRGEWAYHLDIAGTTVGRQFRVEVVYSTDFYRRDTVEQLVEEIYRRLRALAGRPAEMEVGTSA
ncbi:condensation domain-containing protein [Polymorphospora sp. NPDC051019]|uniref:condensation domain-containing protein n=1 Tax=Polymorphospora sp. NPDC051019 TaxID=3155725 RepID=UPI00343CD034